MKFIFFIVAIALTQCATRPLGDEKTESATGIRTMISGMWCGVGFSLTCAEKAITEAKKDCAKENKNYEYSSHDVSSVRYKCISLP